MVVRTWSPSVRPPRRWRLSRAGSPFVGTTWLSVALGFLAHAPKQGEKRAPLRRTPAKAPVSCLSPKQFPSRGCDHPVVQARVLPSCGARSSPGSRETQGWGGWLSPRGIRGADGSSELLPVRRRQQTVVSARWQNGPASGVCPSTMIWQHPQTNMLLWEQ